MNVLKESQSLKGIMIGLGMNLGVIIMSRVEMIMREVKAGKEV
jgi:hypothetical protein